MAGRKRRVQYFNDFTGGLNLDSPRQNLAMNETFDCQDVDFNGRGGFTQRKGVQVADGTVLDKMNGGYLLGSLSLGTDMVVGVSVDKRLWTWDGATDVHVATAVTDQTDFVRMATWGSKVYLANCWSAGALVMRHRTTASLGTATTLANTFNDNYTAPAGGCMPQARLVAQHQGYMWVADTVESSTRHRSRVRWSHPLQPEDWATADYFDIDPDDETDEIVALVPFKDMLLVFKRKSLWGIYGYDSDSFTPQRISSSSGAASQEGITSNAGVCYWWSTDGEVFAFNGKGAVPIGRRVSPAANDGSVNPDGDHRLIWAQNKLFASLETAAGGRKLFVFDPAVGRSGTWTFYSLQATSFAWWVSTAGTNHLFATLDGKDGIFEIGLPSQVQDEFVTGVLTPIDAYYSTAWFSGGNTAFKKQFKRMHLTAATQDACTFYVDVFTDFNDSVVTRTLSLDAAVAGTGMSWDSGVWDSGIWGGADDNYYFERLPSAGRGHAIRFKFRASDNVTSWWIDSFTLPFVEKSY